MKNLLLAAALAAATLGTLVASGCAVQSGQSTVGEYVDDKVITTRVKARLAEDREVSAMRIQVETLRGTVQLSGFAVSQAEKDRAARIAREVPEVQAVTNNIIVRPAQ